MSEKNDRLEKIINKYRIKNIPVSHSFTYEKSIQGVGERVEKVDLDLLYLNGYPNI